MTMAKLEYQTFDGLNLDRYLREGDQIVRHRTQANRDRVLRDNERLRAEPEAMKRPEDMVWALRIPEDDYPELVKRNPELESKDPEIAGKAWRKFAASDESLPFRVRNPSKRGMSV